MIMDNLVRNLTEWCPIDGYDAWPIMRQAADEIRSLRAQVEQARRASLSIAWPMNVVGAWTQAVANAAVQQIERHEDKEPRA